MIPDAKREKKIQVHFTQNLNKDLLTKCKVHKKIHSCLPTDGLDSHSELYTFFLVILSEVRRQPEQLFH